MHCLWQDLVWNNLFVYPYSYPNSVCNEYRRWQKSPLARTLLKASEYDQEMPQTQTAETNGTSRKRHRTQTAKQQQEATSSLISSKMIAKLERTPSMHYKTSLTYTPKHNESNNKQWISNNRKINHHQLSPPGDLNIYSGQILHRFWCC